ncbi:MAG TPA: hypothetical protein VFS82_02470 [Lysobacter sp.]|nr:hypothetical protein [Lysobacter sp.]
MSAPVDDGGRWPFRIDFRHDKSRLRAEVTGRMGSLENILAFWRILAAEALRLGVTTLLIVDAAEGDPLEPEQLHEFIRSVNQLGLKGVRIAYVETDDARLPNDETAEILARELGYVARIFGHETEAALWLRYGES